MRGRSKAAGHWRAKQAVPKLGACEECGDQAVDRHHRDGDPLNNAITNIAQLCRRCHMKIDGRLDAFRKTHGPVVPLKPCRTCGELAKPLRKGECSRCAWQTWASRHVYDSATRRYQGVRR